MMKALIIAREHALIDRIVSLLRAEGVDAAGTTSDEEAVNQLESGAIGCVVIGGGVPEPSRQHLCMVAATLGVAVIRGAAAGKDPQVYARQELLPQLQQVLR